MYGLTHRLPHAVPDPDGTATVVSLHPRGTVLLVTNDPATPPLVRSAVEADHRLIVAADADQALAALRFASADVLVIDRTLPPLDAATITLALAACTERDVVPTIVIDHDQPLNADVVRAQICHAIVAARRGYLGGGLRSRVAA
jgi:DNA-binding NarL/FixJ family response regulator